ncbi:phage major capsid protein [Clostridium sp. SL.3.18]|nr:phage major capsid protein [Clostridium sp. SL.3.18]
MNVQELINKRANVWENAKAFLEDHRNNEGILSAEDGATYDHMEDEITSLTKEIDRLQRQRDIDDMLGKPTATPLTGKPGAGAPDDPEKVKTGRASEQYRKDMLTAFRTNFRKISNVLQESVPTEGGYLVPEEWDSRLIDVLTEDNIMRSLGTTITTSGGHRINIAATKPAAAWIDEGGELTFGEATFEQKNLDAYKLHVAIKITEELLYDNAFNLENYIITQFGKAISNAEEDAFLNGDGNKKPTGIFDATNGGTVGVTLSGATIKTDDIISLIYALKRPYRRNASFILNDATLAAIRKLKDNNGAYLWQPSYQAGEPDRICGYVAHTSPYAPVLEAGKPVMAFGDYSYYNIGDRGTRTLQELRELFAGNGMVGYVMKERVDGLLVLPEAVQIMQAGASA